METGQSKGKPAYRKYWIFLYGAILGAVFDIFFYNKTLGISYPLFILIILSIIFLTFWGNVKELRNWSWFFAVPAMLLSLTFFLYSNQLLKTLNYFLIPILIITLASKVAGVNRADWSDIRFVGDIAKRVFVPFRFIHRPFMEVPEAGDKTDCACDENNNKRKGKGRLATKIIAGFLISIPILAIILWLLTSADIVFKNFFINIPAAKIFKHFLIIASVSIYSICFIWTLKKAFKERQENKLQARQYKRQLKQFLDPVVLLTILILINAVYLVFSFIQFAYLFGGSSYILPSSFTYAEYARRGFAELTAVTIINFAILLFSVAFVKKESIKIYNVVRSFLTLLVVFTFLLLLSAFYRMVVYEQAYGFTYLRVFVQAFMVMLFFLFVANIVYIWYKKIPIVKAYFIIAMAVYIILNFVNVDTIIAKNNINRYFKTGNIDAVYLKSLSYDAVPETLDFYVEIKDMPGIKNKQIADELLQNFSQRKLMLENDKSWQSFNISKHKARLIINKHN